MHADVSGLGEYLAENDADGIAHRARARRQAALERRSCPRNAKIRSSSRCTTPRSSWASCRPTTASPYDVREVDRAPGRRLRLPRVQGRSTDRHTLCGHAEIEGQRVGIIGNNGPIHRRRRDQGGAVHPALRPAGHADRLPAEHHRLHGRARSRARPASIKHGSKMIQAVANATRAAVHRRDRRLVRRRQLRHVRPRLRSALHLRLAQRPHRGDGRRAGGKVMEIVIDAEAQARGQAGRQGRARYDGASHRQALRRRIARAFRHRAAVGRRHRSTRATRATCWASRCRSAARPNCARSKPTRFGVEAHVIRPAS